MSFKPSQIQIPPPSNESRFEDLCLDLYTAEFGDKTQKNGRRGQPQQGVDVFVPDKDIGIQCKKRDIKRKITEQELEEEVEKAKNFRPGLKRFILATTCQRDTKIQKTGREISKKHEREGLFSVEIHSWEEIKHLFDKHPEVYEKYYVDVSSQKQVQLLASTLITNSIPNDSRHQELNRIRDIINEYKPKAALEMLRKFEKGASWERLESKEKYRILTNKACAQMQMKPTNEAAGLLIRALQFNKEDEKANANCASAYLIIGDTEQSKKYIKKVKQLNPLNITAHCLEIQIKDKEGCTLEDIISSLPEAIRENHQTALILSYIGLKRNRYAEAKRYLNIFEQHRPIRKRRDAFEQQDLMDVRDMTRYADISLSLILAKPDIFSGRRVPDSLKNELKKITEIYQKLVTDSQYSELAEFNPDWHLHYALTLELSGQIDKAIQALQNGIDRFPADEHLKIELGRLFTQQDNILKSISLLEKQLGLSFSASGDFSDFINKKPSASNQINISGKTFHLSLILTDLYFYSNQNNKAWRLLEKIIEDPSVNEADRLEAQQRRVFHLISFGKINEAEKQINPLFEKNQNDMFTLILKSKIENFWEETKVREGNPDQAKKHKLEKITYLKKACNIFRDKKYTEQTGQNSSCFESRERLRDIQRLSKELYQSEMYQEAEPLLEEITGQNLNHPEIFNLLHSYFKNGKNRQTIDLAEDLLKKFPDRPEPATILFHLYQDLGDTQKAVQYYENFIQANPTNSSNTPMKLDIIHTYIDSGQIEKIEKARALLKGEFDPTSLSPDLTSQLSIAYAKTGNTKKALKIQYQNIKKHPGRMDLENVYFSLIMFLNKPRLSDFEKTGAFQTEGRKPEDAGFLNPEKVGLDCYVQIKDIKSSEEQDDIIIEENSETYTLKHELSQALLGKKAGDKVSFMNKTYQIKEVKSKYIHKFHEIIKNSEFRYGSKADLRSANISTDPDIVIQDLSKALREFDPGMSKRHESVSRLFQAYRERKAPVGLIAKITGRHPLRIMEYLILKDKWVSAFPGLECYDEAQEHLENRSSLLLDLFSLVMIHQIKMEESLKNSKFDLYVCQSTIDSLKEFGNEKSLHYKDGLLTAGFDEKGELKKDFVPAKDIKQDLNFLIKVKTWAEERCRIKSISSDFVLKREKRRELEVIGKEFLDPLLALYNDPSIVFLSEDATLRAFLRSVHQEIDTFQERGKKSSPLSVRLFDLIEYLKRKAVIENKEEIQFKAGLIKLNQTYIPIDHHILLFLLKEAEYAISNIHFQRGLFFLGPVSNLSGASRITADFFIELCQDPSLLPYRRQMIINEVLNRVSFGRKEKAKQTANRIVQLVQLKARFLPLLQNELYRCIMEWLKGKIY